jgi:hypothetical protein
LSVGERLRVARYGLPLDTLRIPGQKRFFTTKNTRRPAFANAMARHALKLWRGRRSARRGNTSNSDMPVRFFFGHLDFDIHLDFVICHFIFLLLSSASFSIAISYELRAVDVFSFSP